MNFRLHIDVCGWDFFFSFCSLFSSILARIKLKPKSIWWINDLNPFMGFWNWTINIHTHAHSSSDIYESEIILNLFVSIYQLCRSFMKSDETINAQISRLLRDCFSSIFGRSIFSSLITNQMECHECFVFRLNSISRLMLFFFFVTKIMFFFSYWSSYVMNMKLEFLNTHDKKKDSIDSKYVSVRTESKTRV